MVLIINSVKLPKIDKILLYEMKFLLPSYSCLQNPWLRGYRPQIPFLSVLNWIFWTPPNKFPGYATEHMYLYLSLTQEKLRNTSIEQDQCVNTM